MNEVHRVTTHGGKIEIIVPHFSNVFGYSDPTHVRLFGIYSMFYFCRHDAQPKRKVPDYYTDRHYIVEKIEIRFYQNSLIERLIAPTFSFLINLNFHFQELYERRLSAFWHASEIYFLLRPVG